MSIPILSTVNNATNNGNVTITFYKLTATPTQPAQQTTITEFPATNPSWARGIQITSEYVMVKRGTGSFAIPISDLVGIAVDQVPALSYPPFIIVQPLATSCNSAASNSTNTAQFNVTANSESTLTYAWREYNGSAWSSNITNGTSHNATYTVSSNVLTIHPTTNETNGFGYVSIIYNSSGSTNSSQVTLTVL